MAEPDELHISVPWPHTPPRTSGVIGHVVRSDAISPDIRHGFPVVSVADAWVQSGRSLRREDLVAAGDFLVTGLRVGRYREPALSTVTDLAAAARRGRGSPGAPRVAWAIPRLRVGPDSRPESLLRLMIAEARLPEPVIHFPVPVEGGITLHPDLAFVGARVALEYEGDGHRIDRAT
jgi:hypothetical protein